MDKRVLVTGANSGMGKALSLRLARDGYAVVMLCRDPERGRLAVEETARLSGNAAVSLLVADLGSLASVRAAVEVFMRDFGALDVLVDNAGVILPRRRETDDGFEYQFGVNHLGHFALTLGLLPALARSDGARIVIVSSGAHVIGKLDFGDIGLTSHYSAFGAYGRSKLANLLFGYELADRLRSRRISVNCLHPGAVGTGIGVDRDTGFGKGVTGLLRPFFKTPEQGADTAYYLATDPAVGAVTGEYFVNRRIRPSSKKSRDKALAKRLWALSAEMTGAAWPWPEPD
jgi:NAD(P)-dependent dehydrogenase (short-subunit alcohol dehydrogenase family)